MVSLGEKAKAMNVTQKRMKRNNTFLGFDPPLYLYADQKTFKTNEHVCIAGSTPEESSEE